MIEVPYAEKLQVPTCRAAILSHLTNATSPLLFSELATLIGTSYARHTVRCTLQRMESAGLIVVGQKFSVASQRTLNTYALAPNTSGVIAHTTTTRKDVPLYRYLSDRKGQWFSTAHLSTNTGVNAKTAARWLRAMYCDGTLDRKRVNSRTGASWTYHYRMPRPKMQQAE